MKKFFIIFSLSLLFCSGLSAQEKCPTITISGPAGITGSGEAITFAAGLKGEVPSNVVYRWSVSGGTIISGQGTLEIQVLGSQQNPSNITATVEFIGLPESCPNTASETSATVICRLPILADEYGKLLFAEEKVRLAAATETAKRDGLKIYILKYFPKVSPKNDVIISKIKHYLTKDRKLPESSFFIILGPNNGIYNTKIYLVPPDAEPPTP